MSGAHDTPDTSVVLSLLGHAITTFDRSLLASTPLRVEISSQTTAYLRKFISTELLLCPIGKMFSKSTSISLTLQYFPPSPCCLSAISTGCLVHLRYSRRLVGDGVCVEHGAQLCGRQPRVVGLEEGGHLRRGRRVAREHGALVRLVAHHERHAHEAPRREGRAQVLGDERVWLRVLGYGEPVPQRGGSGARGGEGDVAALVSGGSAGLRNPRAPTRSLKLTKMFLPDWHTTSVPLKNCPRLLAYPPPWMCSHTGSREPAVALTGRNTFANRESSEKAGPEGSRPTPRHSG